LVSSKFTAQVTSVYLTVLVSVERYVAVCKPFKARVWFSWRKSSLFCLGVVFFSFLYNLPTWAELDTKRKYAGDQFLGLSVRRSSLYRDPTYVFYYVNLGSFLVIRLIPFTLLAILNSFIYNAVRSSVCTRHEILTSICLSIVIHSVDLAILPSPQTRQMNKTRKTMTHSQCHEVSIARMLLCIVILFLVCNSVTIISHMLESFDVPHPQELQSASNFLVLLNAALNFVIYCFLSRNFRKVLLRLLGAKRDPTDIRGGTQPGRNRTTIPALVFQLRVRERWQEGLRRQETIESSVG